ncbi:MAG: LysR family transcriptional regulator [Burkholderiales bacterium]|nr:LysR family transcriptional regulator [Burkholderiales bacterium]MDE2453936.1 LysR family transcriptional regulator [Burkholderiales bacterium]
MTVSADMLAAFAWVAELASVSRAADELGVGKSVVSKRVAQLEAELGATLFSRSTRRVALTPAGEGYLEYARRALQEMAAGDEHLRALRSELTGLIRLTATVSWGQRVLAKQLPEFARLHPGIELELHLDDRVADLAFGRLDLALRWSATPCPDLVATPVARIDWALAAAPAYLATARAPQAPAELAGHACLCYWREAADELWTLESATETAQVRVRGRYHVDNPEAVADAAVAGLGIAMLPDYLCREALAEGRLVRVLPEWSPQTRYGTQITAVATPERMRLSRNRALLEFLRQRFE